MKNFKNPENTTQDLKSQLKSLNSHIPISSTNEMLIKFKKQSNIQKI